MIRIGRDHRGWYFVALLYRREVVRATTGLTLVAAVQQFRLARRTVWIAAREAQRGLGIGAGTLWERRT